MLVVDDLLGDYLPTTVLGIVSIKGMPITKEKEEHGDVHLRIL